MKRKLLITGAMMVILGGAVAGAVLAWGSAAEQPAANPALPPATAQVTRTTLVETRTLPGTLGYGDPAPLSATGTGTLTWIAPVGSTVKRGGPLFKVDERPVVALYGSLPLYRTLQDAQKALDALKETAAQEASQAQLALAEAQDAYDDAVKTRNAMNYPHTTDKLTIEKAETDYLLVKAIYKEANKEYIKYQKKNLTNSDRVRALNNLVTAKQDMESKLAIYNWYLLNYTDNEIAQADAELAVAKANLESAQVDWDNLKNGTTEAEIALAEATLADVVQQLEENLAELGYTGFAGVVTIDVLANDGGKGLRVSAVSNPSNGTAVVNADNTITYTPSPGFAGVDTFSYTATDANDLGDSAEVTVVVTPAPPPPPPVGPVTNPEVATTSQVTQVTIDVLANDIGEDLQVSAVTDPSNGTAVVNADNTITYMPSPGYAGVDTFSYTATDANDLGDSAEVTVVVTPAPPPPPPVGPVANPEVATSRQNTPDATYTSDTAEAVRTWQADLGLPETGTVEPGQVVFIPGPVRIAEHTARVGDVLGERGVPVLSYTGTARLVTVQLNVADQALALEGRTVTVTVPGVGAVEGEISQVGTVVTTQEGTTDARIEVTVTIADQEDLGTLDAAPVDVDFVSEERTDVLAVPVAALLALAEGGFGVEIVDGDTTRIVPVNIGMFAAGRVEVSGEGIAEGVTVGVPK